MSSSFELYFLIFIDSLVANIAICFKEEIAVFAAFAFDQHNKILLVLNATFAAIIAYIFNYYFGKIMKRILQPFQQEHAKANQQTIAKLEKNIVARIIFVTLLFSPLGKFASLFAGFTKIKLDRLVVVSFTAKLLYYILLAIYS